MIVSIILVLTFILICHHILNKKNKAKKGGDMASNSYGILVDGVDIAESKVYGIYKFIPLVDGKSYTEKLPEGAYYTVSMVYDNKIYLLQQNDSPKINCHSISLSNNELKIIWGSHQPALGSKPVSVTIWR